MAACLRIFLAAIDTTISGGYCVGGLKLEGEKVDAARAQFEGFNCFWLAQVAGGFCVCEEGKSTLCIEPNFGCYRENLRGDQLTFGSPRVNRCV